MAAQFTGTNGPLACAGVVKRLRRAFLATTALAGEMQGRAEAGDLRDAGQHRLQDRPFDPTALLLDQSRADTVAGRGRAETDCPRCAARACPLAAIGFTGFPSRKVPF